MSQEDKMSGQNFSTSTKSKFNTIDQYKNQGATCKNNKGSLSRHNSPIKLINKNSYILANG